MVQIFYGDGKGKTSALNGAAIRAKSVGMNVKVFRFLKGMETSEDQLLKDLGIIVTKINVGTKFVFQMNEDEKKQLKKFIDEIIFYIKTNIDKYEVIILDEFLDLAEKNVAMLSDKEIVDFVDSIKHKEVLISGHRKNKELLKNADLVTYFKKEKHYFDNGIKARKGFEF